MEYRRYHERRDGPGHPHGISAHHTEPFRDRACLHVRDGQRHLSFQDASSRPDRNRHRDWTLLRELPTFPSVRHYHAEP